VRPAIDGSVAAVDQRLKLGVPLWAIVRNRRSTAAVAPRRSPPPGAQA
jgi:hypothetical protein